MSERPVLTTLGDLSHGENFQLDMEEGIFTKLKNVSGWFPLYWLCPQSRYSDENGDLWDGPKDTIVYRVFANEQTH